MNLVTHDRLQPEEACTEPPLPGGPRAAATAGAGSRRRRLWELPAQAHELLLAMGIGPQVLRRELARVLGHVHKARCTLGGRDVDVLYATVHDLATRNAISEALHRRLDERHASALRRWLPLRGYEALLAAWRVARDDGNLAGELWALLTHPQGGELEREALHDARAWVFHHARSHLARAAVEHECQQRAEHAERVLEEARARTALQQQQSDAALQRLRAELARAAGEAARWRALAEEHPGSSATRVGVGMAPPRATGTGTAAAVATLAAPSADEGPAAQTPPLTRPGRPPQWASSAASTPWAPSVPPAQAVAGSPPGAGASKRADGMPEPIVGRNVLCVGGIRHAAGRYRIRVERLGARFEHHDGGIEDGIQGLDGQLRRADLVICQAACINHEAYHRIKRHCERTGKPCLYLERPSLAQFDRALSAWTAPSRRSAAQPTPTRQGD
ncbi:MAG: DUF2325 domain-containing protein [Burkholderiales bacterium]|nr:DUF2325 domain-containing protein [Burkholderiales bacterium]